MVGIMAHISIQVILNIAVVTNSIPNTGISTLPFISYEVHRFCCVHRLSEMGLALSVSRGIRLDGLEIYEKKREERKRRKRINFLLILIILILLAVLEWLRIWFYRKQVQVEGTDLYPDETIRQWVLNDDYFGIPCMYF